MSRRTIPRTLSGSSLSRDTGHPLPPMGETVIDHARTAVTCSTIPSFSQAPIPAERATGTGAAWPAWKIGAVVSALRSTNAEQGSASRLTVADRSRPVVLVPCGPFVPDPDRASPWVRSGVLPVLPSRGLLS